MITKLTSNHISGDIKRQYIVQEPVLLNNKFHREMLKNYQTK